MSAVRPPLRVILKRDGALLQQAAAPAASELRRERRALLLLREERLRELGGLTLEMYRRDHFNETLVVERCAELVAIEARASEIEALLQGAEACAAAVPRSACAVLLS